MVNGEPDSVDGGGDIIALARGAQNQHGESGLAHGAGRAVRGQDDVAPAIAGADAQGKDARGRGVHSGLEVRVRQAAARPVQQLLHGVVAAVERAELVVVGGQRDAAQRVQQVRRRESRGERRVGAKEGFQLCRGHVWRARQQSHSYCRFGRGAPFGAFAAKPEQFGGQDLVLVFFGARVVVGDGLGFAVVGRAARCFTCLCCAVVQPAVNEIHPLWMRGVEYYPIIHINGLVTYLRRK